MPLLRNNDSNDTNDNDYNSAPAQAAGTSPFDRIGDSNPNDGGVYPEPGVYPMLYVDVLKMIKSRKGEDVFIAEFGVINSDVPDRPVGSRMSWVANFKHDAAPGNVRSLLSAIMGVSINDVDSQGSQFAVSDKNPCHGRLVRLSATQITTKAGNPFTLCKFDSISDEHQTKSEEYRKTAGFDSNTPI